MDRATFLAALEQADMTQCQFADYVGVDQATVYRWGRDRVVPHIVSVLLALMARHRVTIRHNRWLLKRRTKT